MKINAFCTSEPLRALENCDKVIYCGDGIFDDPRIEEYKPFVLGARNGDRIYISDMSDFDTFECACDHILERNAFAIVRAAYDLTESGIVEAKYKLSPIMLLHKMGVLDRCIVVGGVCLDNDDLDLMAQEGIPLVVTPTASAGYGYGFAPAYAAMHRDVRVGIGTFDGKYNTAHDLAKETELLRLTSNADMRRENVFADADISKFIEFA